MTAFEEASRVSPPPAAETERSGNGMERVSSRRLLRKRKLAFRFREEEGRSGYAVFAAPPLAAETEWSEFLLTTPGCSAVGSAGGLGPSGRGFKSLHSDQTGNGRPSASRFLFHQIRDLNPSGSEWRAGGTPEPRGGLPRRAGQVPLLGPMALILIQNQSHFFFERIELYDTMNSVKQYALR